MIYDRISRELLLFQTLMFSTPNIESEMSDDEYKS